MQVRFLSGAFASLKMKGRDSMADRRKHNKKPLISNIKEYTLKDRVLIFRDWIMKNARIVFPVIGVAVIVITVVIAMALKKDNDAQQKPVDNPSEVVSGADVSQAGLEMAQAELEINAHEQVNALVDLYFNAMTTGDVDVVANLHNNIIKDTTKIRIQELSKYIDSYPFYEVYTKPGPRENSYMAYVYYKVLFKGYETQVPGLQVLYICPDEEGNLYIRNEAGLEDSELEYIELVEEQEDVKELKNRITVENDEVLLDESNGIYVFMTQLTQEVEINVGTILADKVEAENNQVSGNELTGTEGTVSEGNMTADVPQDTTQQAGFATTTATINVRNSDSMTADKVGKLASGTQVEVLEKLANGWCKIMYENKEAYVKTDYLNFIEDVSSVPVIGTVTANTNVNVRASADETAARLGVARGGESYELLETVDGWCKIKYEGQVGYVKAEFVTQN